MKKIILISTFMLSSSISAFANQSELKGEVKSFSKSLAYRLGVTYTTNLKDTSLSEHFSSVVYSPVISSNYFENFPINVSFNFSQSNNSDESFSFGNIVVSNSGTIGKGFMRSHSIILPTSKNSRDIKNSLGNLTNTLIYNYSKDIFKDLSFSASFAVTYNHGFHQYKTDLYGMSNIQSLFTETTNLGLSFKDFSFSSYFGLAQAFSYSNNLVESYHLGHSLGYGVSKNLAFSILYSSGGSLLAPNGEDLGIKLFDKDNDTFSFNANYTF